jgi:hypothetical protein
MDLKRKFDLLITCGQWRFIALWDYHLRLDYVLLLLLPTCLITNTCKAFRVTTQPLIYSRDDIICQGGDTLVVNNCRHLYSSPPLQDRLSNQQSVQWPTPPEMSWMCTAVLCMQARLLEPIPQGFYYGSMSFSCKIMVAAWYKTMVLSDQVVANNICITGDTDPSLNAL